MYIYILVECDVTVRFAIELYRLKILVVNTLIFSKLISKNFHNLFILVVIYIYYHN
jgi:hypothetical protein